MRNRCDSSNHAVEHIEIVLAADCRRLRAMTGQHGNRGLVRFSIVPVALALLLAGCNKGPAAIQAAAVYRPSPTDPTPMGIAYLCDGNKEVKVVYAKARASVTFEGKTWRLNYQAGDGGLSYGDSTVVWQGRDDLVTLRQSRDNRALAFNCRPQRQIS